MSILFYVSVFAAGIIGSMGMGGGTILIPALVIFANFGQHTAQTFNLIAFVPLAIVSLCIHVKNKLIKFKPALFCSLFAAASGIGASFFAQKIKGNVLSKVLGGFLILLAIIQVVNLLRKR